MVDLQRTRANSRIAEELLKRVQTLVELIGDTAKEVQKKIDRYDGQLGNAEELKREESHFDKPKQFNKTIETLARCVAHRDRKQCIG